MSGIAGIIYFNGRPADLAPIMQLTAAMSNRGPHGINYWVSGSIALGQCMLRTTPESLEETQPHTNEDESLVLVMDGYVDNWEELRNRLRATGANLRTRADTELVLRAYETWGEDYLSHIEGDFALAIWDRRRAALFCARDRFGVKPFYYHRGKTFIAFASDEEAFFGLPEIPIKANEDRIACTFVHQFDGVDFNDSWLEGIVKLPPAKLMSVNLSGQATIRTYWQLFPRDECLLASDAMYEDAFRATFTQALRRRMRSLGPPALMLSGGIDSAAIAGAARNAYSPLSSACVHTFSVVSDLGPDCTETQNIHSIISDREPYSHLTALGAFRRGTGKDDLNDAAWSHAHPVGNSILLPAMMYLAASRSDIHVMADGIDGDIVTGTPNWYYTDLMRSGAWRLAWLECRQVSAHHTYLRQRSPLFLFSRGILELCAPHGLKRLVGSVRGSLTRQAPTKNTLISADFAKRIFLTERLNDWQKRFKGDHRSLNESERHIREVTSIGIPRGMEAFDRVAARYGVEARHPWVDRQLMEFYVSLPLRAKVRDGWTKFLARRAASPWLDHMVCWNSGKEHLGWQITRGLMADSRDQIASFFRGEGSEILKEFVDLRLLNRLVHKYQVAEISDNGIEDVFHAITVALWLQRLQRKRCAGNGLQKTLRR